MNDTIGAMIIIALIVLILGLSSIFMSYFIKLVFHIAGMVVEWIELKLK